MIKCALIQSVAGITENSAVQDNTTEDDIFFQMHSKQGTLSTPQQETPAGECS